MSVKGWNLAVIASEESLMRSGSASSKRANSSFRFFTTMPFQMLIFSFESS